MNSELFAVEVEGLLRKAVYECDGFTEDNYGRAIANCCGAEIRNPNLNTNIHESDCWLIAAKKLLGIE